MKRVLLFIHLLCFSVYICCAQAYGRTEGEYNFVFEEWDATPTESNLKSVEQLTYWDDLGHINVHAWSKDIITYKLYESRLQVSYKNGNASYRLRVKYADYDSPTYLNVVIGNFYIEGKYYNAKAGSSYYFNLNNESNNSHNIQRYNGSSKTFYPASATINDKEGSYTSENFNCPSMTVIDQQHSVIIHWNGEKIPLQNSTYDNDTYRTYQSNSQGSVEVLAYRSSSTRSIYLVIVNMRMGNEKIKINFKP